LSTKGKQILSLLVATVVLDQATKLVVDQLIPPHASIAVIPDLFSLTHIRNSGAAFGIWAEEGGAMRLYALIGFSVVAIVFVAHLLRRLPEGEKGLTLALTLVLGGAFGNLIDRLVYGEVIDFMDFYISHFHWPAFNLADTFITLGVFTACCRLLMAPGHDPFKPR
jgi:signal peptidase II